MQISKREFLKRLGLGGAALAGGGLEAETFVGLGRGHAALGGAL